MEKLDMKLFNHLDSTRVGFRKNLAAALGFTHRSGLQKMLSDGYGFSRRGQARIIAANKLMRKMAGKVRTRPVE